MQVLHTGQISEQAPVPSVAESQLRSRELREGATVALDQHVNCSVAFARGQERKVFFAIQGLPQVHSRLPALLHHARPAPELNVLSPLFFALHGLPQVLTGPPPFSLSSKA